MSILGVDVARFQGNPAPWAAIKATGVQFGMAKASQWNFVDSAYKANAKAMKVLPVQGAYHFLTAEDPKAQADFFLNTIGNPTGLLCMMDVERAPTGTDPAFGDVKAFVKRFKELAPGHPLFIYTANWYWGGVLGNPDASDLDCPLWNARYTGVRGPLDQIDPTVSFRAGYGGWDKATVVQFTSSARVGNLVIDADTFKGSVADLQGFTHAQPAPVPIPDRPGYIKGINDAVPLFQGAIAAVKVPPGHGVAYSAGFEQARGDATDALAGLVVKP